FYPEGIPIVEERLFPEMIANEAIDTVVFSYSDVPHSYVMHRASEALAAGADFKLLGWRETMIASSRPVIAVCAVRTGCGKSQTTRYIARLLKSLNKKVVVIRHPMPYGNLKEQAVQRFASFEDLEKHKCTIEEMEEYEPHIESGTVVYSGVDYGKILESAEKEADVILWDGGNNDLPFIKPDLHITVVDPLRPGHELLYHPGETNFLMADVIVINKVDSASKEQISEVLENCKKHNPRAAVFQAESKVEFGGDVSLKGKKVLVVEDGPTLTHGEMTFGAGVVAARRLGAEVLVDPRESAKGSIVDTFKKYPHIGNLLPAMGYSAAQVRELEETINKTPCDFVVIGTPIDLSRLIEIKKPFARVKYSLKLKNEGDFNRLIADAV
ncbi:MAG: GTPase, partial [Deltaproteobacteria bacterium]|nr:GTPase [Deltaproteobacteria bacterium]